MHTHSHTLTHTHSHGVVAKKQLKLVLEIVPLQQNLTDTCVHCGITYAASSSISSPARHLIKTDCGSVNSNDQTGQKNIHTQHVWFTGRHHNLKCYSHNVDVFCAVKINPLLPVFLTPVAVINADITFSDSDTEPNPGLGRIIQYQCFVWREACLKYYEHSSSGGGGGSSERRGHELKNYQSDSQQLLRLQVCVSITG